MNKTEKSTKFTNIQLTAKSYMVVIIEETQRLPNRLRDDKFVDSISEQQRNAIYGEYFLFLLSKLNRFLKQNYNPDEAKEIMEYALTASGENLSWLKSKEMYKMFKQREKYYSQSSIHKTADQLFVDNITEIIDKKNNSIMTYLGQLANNIDSYYKEAKMITDKYFLNSKDRNE